MKRLQRSLLIFGCLILSLNTVSHSSVSVGAGLFRRGKLSLSGYGGLGYAFNQDYFILGLGVGYYIANGLAVGVTGEAWTGSTPHFYKASPEVRYVFYQAPSVKPYIGAFYRRTFYESYNDLDSYGGRLGVYSPLGGRGYAGIGVVYEKLADCSEKIYTDCSYTYPEISFAVGF